MIALDSSIIVAALLSWHEKHEPAAHAVETLLGSKTGAVIPAHALFESYAVTTRLPSPYRVSPADAFRLLKENFREIRLASLPVRSVWNVLQRLASEGLAGGLTYDAIILETSIDSGAMQLLTLNERDYQRLNPTIRIVSV